MPPRYTGFSLGAVYYKPSSTRPSLFHTATAWKNCNTDYYKTLGLESSASPLAIKKQFYSLSKTHHPDLNPNDSEASNRFVKISEAYAVIGNAEKRERYDRELRHSAGPPTDGHRGSHSSSRPFGSRPASGLTNRRRTHFRGPPPSFYRSGGWGSQGEKRTAQADSVASSSAETRPRSDDPDVKDIGGSGLGGSQGVWSNDVPHFDREGHYRTQEHQERRRLRRIREGSADSHSGGTVLINFFVVSGVITLAYLMTKTFESSNFGNRNKDTS